MGSRSNRLFVAAMVGVDVLMTYLAVFAAFQLRFTTGLLPPPVVYHPWQQYVGLAAGEALLLPLLFVFRGLYRLKRNVSRVDEFYALFATISIGAMLVIAFTAFVPPELDFSRLVIALAWILQIVFIWLARLAQYSIHAFLRTLGVDEERVLVIGTGEIARAVLQKIYDSPGLGYRPVGLVAANGESADLRAAEGLPIVGRLDDLRRAVEELHAREVIVAEPSLSHRDILQVVDHCDRLPVNIKVFPDAFQLMASEVSIGDLNGLPMLNVRDVALRGWKLTLKRSFDLVFSAAVLVVSSPLMILIAGLIKLTSPGGPVLYVQERVGLDGQPFPCLKFRTMRPDAEAVSGPVWARPDDDRTTPLGRILRRLSLDELPQYVNVLLGDMSVVGPRPERPYFVSQFSQFVPRYVDRHREKAGLTGWAQVNGLRGQSSIEERTAYDLWYVENWTLWLDFKIILRTLLIMFRDKNAY